ncbi:hypothetical protein MPSEU_001035300 [Mayamaea pseudoterrestris]|nr:hypothetical protein MPSEU_001035300 [Mayamaea pseudoterrestris]
MPVNPDLAKERSSASFSVDRLTHMLDGGRDRTIQRRKLERIIALDPTGVFDNSNNSYLHRTDRHVRALAKHVRLVELCRTLNIAQDAGGDVTQSQDFPLLLGAIADDLPTSLHWVMFVPNIISLCDEEQQKEWLPLCRDWKMIGCYAQTELGHGSNVRALETTATFQPSSAKGSLPEGSWIIHSPSLTSYKFWPGTLGRTANHAMVIARLIDGQGIDRGMHNFLVPLRSMTNHSLLPGVKTGDIGPKIGYNTMDNGFASFDNVVVPRRNMAMRFASVDRHGNYQKKTMSEAAQRISYITMMQVRAYICNEAGKNLAMACTIAVRYSAVRKQGFVDETNKVERQILDYTKQQHRLFPLLAASYCFFFTGKRLLARLFDIEKRLVTNQNVHRTEVKDIHASSSGLKSFTTTVTADGIEDCRKACGGHGFLMCSGLPELLTTYLQNPTVEGDNQMLPQQVVKVLLKLVHAVQRKNDLSEFETCDSMLLIPSLQIILQSQQETCGIKSMADMMDLESHIMSALRHRAARLLVQVAQQLEREQARGQSPQQAWNTSLVLMSRTSRAYSQLLLLHNFVDGIDQEEQVNAIGTAEVVVLRDLARLFALYWMERELGDFLEDSYMNSHQALLVHQAVLELLERIRPNAVALVDARDFSDFRLKSALGRFDGNVYPAIMEAAMRDPLNQNDIGPGYNEHLKRLIAGGTGAYVGTASRL